MLRSCLALEDGKPEKREQFLKEPLLDQQVKLDKGRGKEQEKDVAMAK